ncbi:autotransporter domain-containing protein [Bradyrhizobium sp. CIAT3101]|uniref:autotransporter outer membrane beta-barrel domain-containing protein n=1 Tax=Bradyrhizobium sp. CIAT3101 TaxID=439387 RepID=UPI0024B073CD|nr:autotransporter domain-containing protein [Bradyrhizobium sp. CIAT3101]WFU81966.1 autotransporter domain-containing protein [Bradyrhizobium sp. CIAT3101]
MSPAGLVGHLENRSESPAPTRLRTSALTSTALAVVLAAGLMAAGVTTPVYAGGAGGAAISEGTGGTGGFGGGGGAGAGGSTGGASVPTGGGHAGNDADAALYYGAGGGGGADGALGSPGGQGTGGAAGGISAGQNGVSTAANGGGGGGAGNTHGWVGTTLPVGAATGGTGGDGGSASGFYGGGGGGGAGGFGAVVTSAITGPASLGGAIAGGAGGAGGDATVPGTAEGGGGGGGGLGLLVQQGVTGLTINQTVTGGAGGRGGNGISASTSEGGGGGGGGEGVYFAGTAQNIVVNSNVTGGAGGAGGAGTATNGGSGGGGGAGMVFTGGGSVTVNATVSGGNGGALGIGGLANGAAGAGGVGITGSDLSIVVDFGGAVSGGLANGGAGARANAISFTGGTNVLELQGGATITGNVTAFSTADTFRLGGSTNASFDVSNIGAAAQYSGFGIYEKTGTSIWSLTGSTAATAAWLISAGTLEVSSDANLGNVAGRLTFNGGTLSVQFGGGPTVTLARDMALQAGGGTIETSIDTILTGNLSGAGSLTKTGAYHLTLSGSSSYTGATNVMGGQLDGGAANAFSAASAFTVAAGASIELKGTDQSIGSLAGAGTVTNNSATAATLTTGSDNTSTTFSGGLSDSGSSLSLVKVGSGTMTLTGVSTYTGATVVSGGNLEVDGSIASSSNVTVNSGATLSGIGIVDPATTTIMSGGTLAPGNAATPTGTLTVTGNLAFQSGAIYLVQLTPATSSSTNVSGTATLGGATVNAIFANGSYVAKRYTILTATGGLSGSTFGSVVNSNLPSGFATSLSYDNNNAYLNLALAFTSPTGLNVNQRNVGNALTNFFNATGGIPLVFGALTPAGLTQLSGESATAAQQVTFDAMNLFMGVLTDPFIAGRGDPVSTAGGGGVSGYADEQALAYAGKRNPNDALAAIYRKAPAVDVLAQRWSVWVAGYGGSQTTSGNAVLGSNNTSSSTYGTVVGADYRLSPDTLAGFALGGGGTNFSVANALGSGRSDLFQAGAFIRHNAGPAYITAALAYGWQDVTTNRTLAVAGIDQLRAEFNANAWSGRVEGGYRFVTQGFGWTPYAAGQFTTFLLPAYAEQAISGAGTFALNYATKSVTSPRSELGLRADKSFAMEDGVFTLRGRAAWAHDYNPDRSIGATFQTLPGASFVVNGASMASDSALVTAAVEKKWLNGWSAAVTFEGEFSNVTESYAGKGVVRYAW